MASTSERILIDVDLNLKKSERSIDQFVAKARTAVQQANLANIPQGQSVRPAGPSALGIQTGQTVQTVRQAGIAQGLSQQQLIQATGLAQQQGRDELEKYIKERGLTGKSATQARSRFDTSYDQTITAYKEEQQRAEAELARVKRVEAEAAKRKAAAEEKAATEQAARDAKQAASEAQTTQAKAQEATASTKQAANETRRTTTSASTTGPLALTPDGRKIFEKRRSDAAARREATTALGQDPQYQQDRQQTLVERRRQDAEIRRQANEQLSQDKAYLQSKVQGTAALNAQNAAVAQQTVQSKSALRSLAELTGSRRLLNAATKRELERSIRDGSFSGTSQLTRVQRLTAGFGYGGGGQGGGGGGLGLTGGEFFGGGLLSVLRYSLPSLALFGAGRGLIEGFKEAEELEKQFNLIESQYDAVFGAEGQEKANGFKQTILDIAAETGQAAEKVASVGYQFTGAFRDENLGGLSGQDLVDEQLEAAQKLARVTELSVDDITDPLTAASLAFQTPIEEIGNVVLQLQDKFGVLAPEIIGFLGDIAPVAKDAGLSLEEIGTIGAITQQQSGRSGTALAEAYGRVIPAITEAKEELIQLAASNDVLGDQFITDVAQGNIDEQFLTLAKVFEQLDSTSQDFVINLLGGRREAQSILAAFNSSETLKETLDELDAQSGTLEERFDKLQDTLGQTLARLGEQLRQLAIALYEGGLKDAFDALADGGIVVAEVLTTIFGVFKTVNDATGGLIVKLGTLAGTFALVAKGMRAIAGIKLFEGLAARASQFGAGLTAPPGQIPGQQTLPGIAPTPVPVGQRLGAYTTRGGAPRVSGLAGAITLALGVSLVLDKFNSSKEDLQAQEDDLRDRLKEASEEDLEAIANQRTGFFDRAGAAFFGIDLPNVLAQYQQAENRESVFQIRRDAFGGDNRLLELVGEQLDKDTLDNVNAILQGNKQFFEDSVVDELASGKGGTGNIAIAQFTEEDLRNPEVLDELLRLATEGEGRDQQFAQSLLDIIFLDAENNADIAAKVAEARAKQEGEEILSEAEAKQEEVAAQLDELKAQYEAGDIGLDQYLEGFDRNIAALRQALSAAYSPELNKALQTLVKDRAKVYSDALLAQEQQTSEIATLAGGETEATINQRIQTLTGFLQDPQFTDPDARSKTARTLVDLYRQQLDDQIAAADSAAEAAQIAREGIEIDPQARQALIISQLNENNVAFQQLTDQVGTALGNNSTEVVKAIFTAILTGDQALIGLYREDLIGKINALNEQIAVREQYIALTGEGFGNAKAALEAQRNLMQAQRDGLFTLAASIDAGSLEAFGVIDPGNKVTDAKKAAEEQKKADEERAKELKAQREARYEVLKALNEDDPIALATIEIAIAQDQFNEAETDSERIKATAAKIRAQNSLRKAQEAAALEEFEARIDVAKALNEGDPIQLAQIAIFEAAAEFNRAKTDAERIKALAARIRAERGLQDAIYDVFNSQIELAKAMAESVQDTVKVAEIGVFEAAANLNRVLAQSPQDQAAQNRARAQLVSAQTALADTRISKQLEDYQYLYDMEQITKEQYINYLTALRATLDPVAQQQQFRDISRTIKQLKGDLAQDLQFNLPTSINLPTLYEARRLNQSVGPDGSQIGYQDNRNVTVSLYITNGMTQQEAVDLLNAALGTNTVGYGGRRY